MKEFIEENGIAILFWGFVLIISFYSGTDTSTKSDDSKINIVNIDIEKNFLKENFIPSYNENVKKFGLSDNILIKSSLKEPLLVDDNTYESYYLEGYNGRNEKNITHVNENGTEVYYSNPDDFKNAIEIRFHKNYPTVMLYYIMYQPDDVDSAKSLFAVMETLVPGKGKEIAMKTFLNSTRTKIILPKKKKNVVGDAHSGVFRNVDGCFIDYEYAYIGHKEDSFALIIYIQKAKEDKQN